MVWKFAFNYEIKEGRGEKGRRAGESEEEGEPEEWELLREGGREGGGAVKEMFHVGRPPVLPCLPASVRGLRYFAVH